VESLGLLNSSVCVEPHIWKHRPVLVTGASGMIGSWLVKSLLECGARIVALVRDVDPQSELYRSGVIRRVSVVRGHVLPQLK
jgi:CDP-glucose 4,6-dehydratase